ncbi:hypothetical protein GALMADRAFT_236727 [Galerina marginata CBS 339.88]|uniref:1-acyl-sn-glycerol-3-phosphate acyltransferase n=1 Tax=Galerina marginata (strain CBS 339.88) TaxID=685588 RepID=A0A067TYG1_GALM3|nr:hypothetical protein GALMADRAFT_236727 [Galerina marginata CBS 339.88]
MSFLVAVFKPLAYISLPIILVRQVAVSSSIGRYYARVVVYVGTLMTVASCSIVIAAGMSLIGRSTDVNNIVAKIFYGVISRALDLKVEVEGEENLRTSPAVLMANHQSMLDVLIVGRLMPKQTAIMSKKSLQYTPLGPFMSMSGTIFIDRGNSASAFRSIDAAGAKMKRDKTSLWMFPEGTRHLSKTPDMLPLKKGGFHLAINAGIPIIPLVTENYWHMYRKGVFMSGTIKVRVLPPIPTTGLTAGDVGSLASRVRSQMLEALHDLAGNGSSEKYSVQPKDTSSKSSESGDGPLESTAALLSPSIGVGSESLDGLLQKKGSSSSIASSAVSASVSATGQVQTASEAGTETEEDEGMILVGRPH